MASVLKPGEVVQGTDRAEAQKKLINLVPVLLVFGLLTAIYAGLRIYTQMYAFEHGLDSTTPEFEKYWMGLLKLEVPLIFGVGIAIWTWLWVTRDKNLHKLDAETELKRYFGLVAWFLCYTFSFVFIASFFGEGDAVWHQTVVRDTSFTPSHIVVFYACIPLYIVVGVGSLIYATTRLPKYAYTYSVPMIMVVLGPALILPNLGFNEWGHAFWITEEIFTHPLHWGFVVLGWTGLGFGGALLQVVARMAELFMQIKSGQRPAVA